LPTPSPKIQLGSKGKRHLTSPFFTEFSQTRRFGFSKRSSRRTKSQQTEWKKCKADPVYFIRHYCKIEDPQDGGWIDFDLWAEQENVVRLILDNQKAIALKARQLGLSWLAIAFAIWLMEFYPGSAVGLFSRRDTEAIYLLDDRMKGMWQHIPEWLRSPVSRIDSAHHWRLANGSSARAFPTSAGDGYTFSFVIVDEADLVPDLDKLLKSVKPTIDAGGKILLLSKSDKKKPQSQFKRIYRAAKRRANEWREIFLAWSVRPERSQDWYDAQCRDALETSGTLDEVHENYPANDAEALSPNSKDKRFPAAWLDQCFEDAAPIEASEAPAVRGLTLYKAPEETRRYAIGADPAEGNPTSDDSVATILDWETWEEVGVVSAKMEPGEFAGALDSLSRYYNRAEILVERNNHGHAVLLKLRETASSDVVQNGPDDRPGYNETAKSKAILLDQCAEVLKDGDTTIRTLETYTQLANLEASTLKAPADEHDDYALSFALALYAVRNRKPGIVLLSEL
jgi:hypothetical protein